jgi:hypothetical protein
MIDDGRIDLDTFNARYGLFSDALRRQIRIELPTTSQVFNYTSIAQSGQDFLFEGTPLRIRFDGANRLIADWSGVTNEDQGTAPTQPQIPGIQGQSSPQASPGSSPAGSPAGASAGAQPVGAPPSASPAQPSASPQGTSTPPGQGQAPITAAAQAQASGTSPTPAGGSPTSSAANQPQGQAQAQPALASASAPQSRSQLGLYASLGGPNATQAVFVILTQDLREVIRAEENRRLNLLGRFADEGSVWLLRPEPSLSPPAQPIESKLSIFRAGRFVWTSIESVPAEYLGTDLGNVTNGAASGEATIRLYLDPSLGGTWEGALSLRFDGTKDWLDFLYRHDEGRLILQPVAAGGVKDLVVMTAGNLAPLSFDGSK